MHVIFSDVPAVLVRIDGEPQYQGVPETGLERVVNTSALILRDEAGMHYLRLGNAWMEAYDMTGRWSIAGMVPEGAERVLRASIDRRADPFASWRGMFPIVFVSTSPAELVVTKGEAQFVPMAGTSLRRVANTSASVFKEPTDHELYVRTASGWFRAWTATGPWQPVSTGELPSDLAVLGRHAAAADPKTPSFSRPRSTPSFVRVARRRT